MSIGELMTFQSEKGVLSNNPHHAQDQNNPLKWPSNTLKCW